MQTVIPYLAPNSSTRYKSKEMRARLGLADFKSPYKAGQRPRNSDRGFFEAELLKCFRRNLVVSVAEIRLAYGGDLSKAAVVARFENLLRRGTIGAYGNGVYYLKGQAVGEGRAFQKAYPQSFDILSDLYDADLYGRTMTVETLCRRIRGDDGKYLSAQSIRAHLSRVIERGWARRNPRNNRELAITQKGRSIVDYKEQELAALLA